SINYSIDELRRLVTGITGAAQQVTAATQEAQTVTGQLLQAAQKQATEIQGTGQSVAQMAQSMNEVSKSANDSAKVAETSLHAAEEADEALRGVEQVSSRLAELIGSISGATQQQAVSAAQVAGKMKIILGITQLTTEGTKKTAASAARLTALADGLKNSVAGF